MLVEVLKELIVEATETAADSHKVSMNSYGAGYDAGFLAALLQIQEILETDGVD